MSAADMVTECTYEMRRERLKVGSNALSGLTATMHPRSKFASCQTAQPSVVRQGFWTAECKNMPNAVDHTGSSY